MAAAAAAVAVVVVVIVFAAGREPERRRRRFGLPTSFSFFSSFCSFSARSFDLREAERTTETARWARLSPPVLSPLLRLELLPDADADVVLPLPARNSRYSWAYDLWSALGGRGDEKLPRRRVIHPPPVPTPIGASLLFEPASVPVRFCIASFQPPRNEVLSEGLGASRVTGRLGGVMNGSEAVEAFDDEEVEPDGASSTGSSVVMARGVCPRSIMSMGGAVTEACELEACDKLQDRRRASLAGTGGTSSADCIGVGGGEPDVAREYLRRPG